MTTTFGYTGGPQQYVVPSGITSLVLSATGGSGEPADKAGAPGSGGAVLAGLTVSPGQQLAVWVGGIGVPSGGWGFACGGGRGDGGPGEGLVAAGGDGGGGGGASAVTLGTTTVGAGDCDDGDRPSGDALVLVAGGGGGGGGWGDGYSATPKKILFITNPGTTGGDGGNPAGAGEPARASSSGGCGGCLSTNAGGAGWGWEQHTSGGTGDGGSGGGGGGYPGGEGGHDGSFDAPGGGGGRSFVSGVAQYPSFASGSGLGAGEVSITTAMLQQFTCDGTEQPQIATAPPGATAAQITAQGGAGETRDAQGGTGGIASMAVAAQAGAQFTVFPGCDGQGDGGWGFGNGGDKGTAGATTADDGTGGGGSSAVFVNSDVGLIAGGGGGSGGFTDGSATGGTGSGGGNGGPDPQAGHSGGGVGPSAAGGCAACAPNVDGVNGDHSTAIALGGGGGGGGGGYLGGDGGRTRDSANGGGGGAGSSWISSTGQELNPTMAVGVPGSGYVRILWSVGGPAAVGVYGGAPQRASIGTAFAAPLQAIVTDGSGNAAPGVAVQFEVSALSGQAGGLFPSGLTTASVITNERGIATSPAVTANTVSGAWYASATVVVGTGLQDSAWFALANDPVATSLSVSLEPADPTPLDTLTLTAIGVSAVGAPPVGPVTFLVAGTEYPATFDANGLAQASVPAGAVPVGAATLAARYPGNAHSAPAGAATEFTVSPAATTTTVNTSANPTPDGDPVTLTAEVLSVAGPACVGCTVTFTVDGATAGSAPVDATGVTTLAPIGGLLPGAHPVTAQVSGDADFAASIGHLTQAIDDGGVSVIVTATPSSTSFLDTITVDATVDPGDGTITPTGDLGIGIGSSQFCVEPLVDGHLRCEIDASELQYVPWGSDVLVAAAYDGDSVYSPANGSVAHATTPAATAIAATASADRVVDGTPISFGVAVTIPSHPSYVGVEGFVTVSDNGVAIPALTGLQYTGTSMTTPAVALNGDGPHVITTTFSPFASNASKLAPSEASIVVIVEPAVVSLAVDLRPPTQPGQPVELRAVVDRVGAMAVADGPAGTIDFRLDGRPGPRARVTNGIASAFVASMPSGAHDVTARFSPDAGTGIAPASAAATVVIQRPTRTVVGVAKNMAAGAAFVALAQVLPAAADGTVSFLADGTPLPGCTSVAVVANGARCAIPGQTAGQHVITVRYSGTTTSSASEISVQVVVGPAPRLPATGFAGLGLAPIATALVLLGAAAFAVTRIRRRLPPSPRH